MYRRDGVGLADRSQHDVIQYVQNRSDVNRLVYLYKRPLSANFYSSGQAAIAALPEEVSRLLDRPGRDYVVVKTSRKNELPNSLRERFDIIREYSRFLLMVQSVSDNDKLAASGVASGCKRLGEP